MILTLKGATFTNNIGTLNSWRIEKSLTGITSSNTASSITKGETYSTTLTIKENYSMEGVTPVITVGGVAWSGTLTWSSLTAGGTASLSIPTSTDSGKISISIAANWVGSGDAPEEDDPVVPDGTTLSYIESSGTQFLNTGITYNSNISVKLAVETNKNDYTDPEAIMGAQWSVDGFFFLFHKNKCKFHSKSDTSGQYTSTTSIFDGVLELECNANTFSVNDEVLTSAGTGTNQALPIYLFDAPGTNAARKQGSFKLYYCKMYDNGTLVRDFVPWMDTDGAVGLYDNISKTFFANEGTGSFTSGGSSSGSEGVLTYIESTGTQNINTGVAYSDNIRVDLTLETTQDDYTDPEAIMGAQWSTSGFFTLFHTNKIKYHTKNRYDPQSSAYSATTDIFDGQLNLVITPDTLTINNDEVITPAGSSDVANESLPIYLFDAPGTNTARKQGSFRLYSCKMYEGDTLVRDFVPYRNAYGVIGLYDSVSKAFFANNGSGSFLGA